MTVCGTLAPLLTPAVGDIAFLRGNMTLAARIVYSIAAYA